MSRDRLVLVTQNQHKIEELTPLFNEFNVPFDTTSLEKLEIRSDDVDVIALAAAELAFAALQKPCVVDDTGLYITSLRGFPKSYPAFVLDTLGLSGVLRLLEGIEERYAKFVTAVGYADSEGSRTFIGEMEGSIGEQPIGEAGFGYDPIFIPDGYDRTYAQLDFEEKVSVSHRTKAFRAFLEWYTDSDNA